MIGRNCPQCDAEIVYKTISQLNEAERKGRTCTRCRVEHAKGRHHTDEHKIRMSERFRGERNPMYGKQISDEHRLRLSASRSGEKNHNYGKHLSESTKEKISAANTGREKSVEERKRHADALRGRPGPNRGRKFGEDTKKRMSEAQRNRCSARTGSGWSGWYKGWYFRSISELRYVIEEVEEVGLQWRSAESGDLCIDYQHPSGVTRIYHPDLLIEEKILVEVKPRSCHNNVLVKAKAIAADEFCKQNGLIYKIVDAIPLDILKLEKLCESGEVLLSDKWRTRFLKRLQQIKDTQCQMIDSHTREYTEVPISQIN